MLHALRRHNLLFPLPPGSPGPNGGVCAIPRTLDKCSLIVNLVPINREMPERPQKFSLTSVEVLALLAQVARQGSSSFLPPLYGRARSLRPDWEVLGLPRGGETRNFVCATSTSVLVFGRCTSRKPSGGFPHLGWRGGAVLSFRCLPFGWKYSPILCQKVLEHLVEEIGLVGVLV